MSAGTDKNMSEITVFVTTASVWGSGVLTQTTSCKTDHQKEYDVTAQPLPDSLRNIFCASFFRL